MIRFAVFTDLHCDYMFDWRERMAQFASEDVGTEGYRVPDFYLEKGGNGSGKLL